jgi:hypothetical protein
MMRSLSGCATKSLTDKAIQRSTRPQLPITKVKTALNVGPKRRDRTTIKSCVLPWDEKYFLSGRF